MRRTETMRDLTIAPATLAQLLSSRGGAASARYSHSDDKQGCDCSHLSWPWLLRDVCGTEEGEEEQRVGVVTCGPD